MRVHDNHTKTGGFVMAADDGQAFWFLNTLTINKVRGDDSQGLLSIVDHRVPPGFAPPPHVHEASDEAFLVLDGQFEGFCGDQAWQAGPGSLVYLPHGIAHGFTVSAAGPGPDHRGRLTSRIRPVRGRRGRASAGAAIARARRARSGPPHPARRCARYPDSAPAAVLARRREWRRPVELAWLNPNPAA